MVCFVIIFSTISGDFIHNQIPRNVGPFNKKAFKTKGLEVREKQFFSKRNGHDL